MEQEAKFRNPSFWKNVNLLEKEIPDEIKQKANKINVESNNLVIQRAKVFYREAKPVTECNSHISLLLLHGAAFSSQTWLELGTIQILASMGYHTIAMDIPGFGNSVSVDVDRKTFLHQAVQEFNLPHPVVISPSLSGTFSIPYLLKHWEEMGAYIPVAPVGTALLENIAVTTDNVNKRLQKVPESLRSFLSSPLPNLDEYLVPTMAVFGERDRQRNSALLCLLPCSQAAEIPNGKHPAYLDDPNLWHKLLYNFLGHVNDLISK